MLKLEIDEKFEELSYLYDLFENITRIDYVPLEYREEIKKALIKAYKEGNQEFEKIHEKLKRLEEINKVWHDNEPMESVDINGKHLQDLYDYNEELFNKNLELDKKVIELEKENQELIVNKNVAQAVAFDQKREIGELKDKIAYLKEELEGWQNLYNSSQAKNLLLKLKIQELENDIKLNEAQIDDLTLEVANYKHALEEKNEIIMDLKE